MIINSLDTVALRTHFTEMALKRYRNFETEFRQTRRNPDAENLHDLRVATRRLIAALEFKSSFYPEARYGKVVHILEEFIRPLGKQRDLLLQEDYFQKIISGTETGLKYYLEDLRKKIQANHKEVQQDLSGFNLSKFSRKTHQLPLEWVVPAALPGEESHPDPLLNVDWKRLIREKLEAILSLEEKAIVQNNLDSFHKMRIKLKELRYWLEILEEVFAFVTRDQLALMHRLQTVMGDIHDRDVWAMGLLKFSRRIYPEKSGYVNLAEQAVRLRESRRRKYANFKKLFDQFGKAFSYLQD